MDTLLKYWPVLLVILNGLAAWAAWSLSQAVKGEIAVAVAKLEKADKSLEGDVAAVETRTTRIEGRMDNVEKDILDLPTKADIARVEGQVKSVGDAVAGAADGVKRLEGYFLHRGVESVNA
ncbi:MAG: hypothetical protein JWP35_3525 [Caulobacter sp.]|nr:hypothetical protein [Caulobacter sp.]